MRRYFGQLKEAQGSSHITRRPQQTKLCGHKSITRLSRTKSLKGPPVPVVRVCHIQHSSSAGPANQKWGLAISRDRSTLCNELHRSIASQCDIHPKRASRWRKRVMGKRLIKARFLFRHPYRPSLRPSTLSTDPILAFVTSSPGITCQL